MPGHKGERPLQAIEGREAPQASSAFRRPLVELCVEPTGLCGRCTGVAVPLRVVPSPTGLPSKRGPPLTCCYSWASHSSGFFCCRAQTSGPRGFSSYTPVFLGFTCGSAGKESTCSAGNLGSALCRRALPPCRRSLPAGGPAVTRAPPPAFPRNPRGRLGFPGPTQGEG